MYVLCNFKSYKIRFWSLFSIIKHKTNINNFLYSYIIYKLQRLVVNQVTVLSTIHDVLITFGEARHENNSFPFIALIGPQITSVTLICFFLDTRFLVPKVSSDIVNLIIIALNKSILMYTCNCTNLLIHDCSGLVFFNYQFS